MECIQKEAEEKEYFNSGVRKFIIVGNPNVGKSVLFGRLANKYVTVSNYPGTTVTVTKGWMDMPQGPIPLIDNTRMAEAERISKLILKQTQKPKLCRLWSGLEKFTTHPFGGFLLLAGVLFLMHQFVGEYGAITMAITYGFAIIFPVIVTFFLAFGILEDLGYLPRLSILLNRIFKMIGLNGKAVLPMVLGLGCDTMATVTARILPKGPRRF